MYCGKCSVSRRGVHAIPTRSKRLAMNIVMFTNTYRPHVGGVATSVAWLAENLRGAGHRVLVVAPEFPGCATNEPGVVRIPAKIGRPDVQTPVTNAPLGCRHRLV